MSIAARRPLHTFDNDSIRPGPVGSVGDVIGAIKLKHSMPDLPIRNITLSNTVGANVEDGDHESYTSHGLQARVMDSNWQSGRAFKTSHGWVIEDLRAEDRLHEPFMGSGPQYSWRNTIATTYAARRTGDLFLPLPGGYNPSPGEIERGQVVPEITNIEGGELLASTPLKADPGVPGGPKMLGGSRNTQSGFVRPVPGRR
jgi:hypothetical protein